MRAIAIEVLPVRLLLVHTQIAVVGIHIMAYLSAGLPVVMVLTPATLFTLGHLLDVRVMQVDVIL